MNWSLNEIEAETRKAIRGAGLAWGMAEEGAKAVRWLAEHGIDACPALADVLDRHDGGAPIDRRIVAHAGRWQGREGPLCPLHVGAAISDRAAELSADGVIATAAVVRPLLLVPFVIRAARLAKRVLILHCPSGTLVAGADGTIEVMAGTFDVPEVAEIDCRHVTYADGALRHHRPPQIVAPDQVAWAKIEVYAARTYVPASEQSRLVGAGAGMIDND